MRFPTRFLGVLLPLLLLSTLLLPSCNKDDDKTFDIYRTWRVVSVSRAGVDMPDHSAVGDLYDFQKNGRCHITRKATGRTEEVRWSRDEKESTLYLDDIRYEVYKTERKAFDFGQLVDGNDVGTLHLEPQS